MSPVAATLPLSATATATALEPVAAAVNPTDLDRLRTLIHQTASQTVNAPGATEAVQSATKASFGDSILEGMMRFGSNYQTSLQNIDTRLQDIVVKESSGVNSFSDIMALQIDVTKWSMSVMGVDNASKAGSNTIKELSKGG